MDAKDNDHSLLNMAAKAAGYKKDFQYGVYWLSAAGGSVKVGNSWSKWNPLIDDGDEAVLEAELQMHVIWEPGRNTVVVGRAGGEVEEPYGADRQAARRRAGVRAAAEIGRNMS